MAARDKPPRTPARVISVTADFGKMLLRIAKVRKMSVHTYLVQSFGEIIKRDYLAALETERVEAQRLVNDVA